MEFKDINNHEPELVKEGETFYKSKKYLVLIDGVYPLVASFERDTLEGEEYEAWYCEEYDDISEEVTHFCEIPNLP